MTSVRSLRDKADSAFHAIRESRRSLQVIIVALAIITVIALVAAFAAIAARTTESKRRELAVESRNEAWSRMAAAESARLRYTDPALASQFALAAYRLADTVEGTSALLDSTTLITPSRLIGPPGRTLVSATSDSRVAVSMGDGTIGLFNIGSDASLRERASVPADGATGTSIVSVTRNYLVRGVASTVEIWRLGDSPARVSRLELPNAPIAVSISGDGMAVAAGTEILRWDIKDPKAPVPLPPLELGQPVSALAVSDSTHLIAAGSRDGAFAVWNADGTPRPGQFGVDGGVTALAFSPDGTVLAAGTQSGAVNRWKFEGEAVQFLPILSGLAGDVNALAFSGERMAAAAGAQTQLWLGDQAEVNLPSPTVVTSIAFTAGGRTLVTGGDNGTTQVWPIPAPLMVEPNLSDARLSAPQSGKRIVVGDAKATTIDASTPTTPKALPLPDLPEGEIPSGATAMAADSSYAAVGTESGHVVLWHRKDDTHEPAGIVPIGQEPVTKLALSRSGKLIFAASKDSPKVTVWDIGANKASSTITVPAGSAAALGYDVSRNRLAIGSARNVAVYGLENPAKPNEETSIELPVTPTAVAFSPDGSSLAVGSRDREVLLFDIASGELRGRMSAPENGVQSVSFSPNGRFVAAGGHDEFVWIWDLSEPGAPVRYATLRAYAGPASDALFIGDDYLAGAIDHQGIALWHFNAESAAAALCTRGSTPVSDDEWRTHLPGVPLIETCLG